MNELKVGFLTLLAIASLVGVTLKISGSNTSFGSYVNYKTVVDDATGINENAAIKVAGIPAGKITKVDLYGSQALVSFEVKEEIKITNFSKLRVKTVGFLGDKYIDIYIGNPNAERLASGSFVTTEGGAGIEDLSKDASEILKDIKEIARKVKEGLEDDLKRNMVKDIVLNIRDFTKDAADVAKNLKNIIAENNDKLNNAISNLDKITKQLAFETNRNADGSFMNDLAGIKPILDNVNKASEDLKDIIADVKSGKGTVGKLLRDEEVVDQVSETLAGVNKLMGRVNQFKTDLALYSGVNDKFGGRTDLDLDLIPGPERFFRLGVVFNDYGPYLESKEATYTSVNDGKETKTEERKIDKSKFKFNLQIGRKFNRFAIRAGAIESSGGLGFDYLMPDYGFNVGAEVFDYQDKYGANFRMYTELKLWNVFYTKAMAEDIFSKYGEQNYSLSLGLRFSDEDLASFIGLMAL